MMDIPYCSSFAFSGIVFGVNHDMWRIFEWYEARIYRRCKKWRSSGHAWVVSKAFVRNYTRALNVELKDKGVTLTAVCPGWMKTGQFDRGLIGAKKATKNFSGMVTPDVVAKKAVSDADKGKDMSVYGLYVKMCHLMAKVLPQKVMMKVWLMQQK